MEEEIDILELFTRVKNGNAPYRIRLWHWRFVYNPKASYIEDMYREEKTGETLLSFSFDLDTKVIKILDKPIIEELSEDIDFIATVKDDQMKAEQIGENRKKINEIIRYLKKEKK